MEIGKERLKARLQLYYECEEKILAGAQSYEIGNRTLTRANLSEVQTLIKELEDRLALLEGKAGFKQRVYL